MTCSTEVVSDKCFSKKRKIGHHVRSYISDKNTQTDEFFSNTSFLCQFEEMTKYFSL